MSITITNRFAHVVRSNTAKLTLLVALALMTGLIAHAKSALERTSTGTGSNIGQSTVLAVERPQIEVVFVLDTTGSMSGLIEGAKQKIWSIVNQMAGANTTPDIRVGLIGYRDRGDVYITRHFDLTDDIDSLYANLQSLGAGGGGDGPESVNQALNEAVTNMSWGKKDQIYKVVFLVGDAPPHMDYQDDVRYAESVKLATSRGIVVNTVQCGNDPETTRIWAGIAKLAHGEYVNIAQDGAMVASHTPMDDELAELNVALSDTVIAYGDRELRRVAMNKVKRSLEAAPATVAARLSYLAKKGGAALSGRLDLVDALESGEVDMDTIATEELPAELQAMPAPARSEFIEEKTEERRLLRFRVAELSKSRDRYIAEEAREREAAGKDDSFDDKLLGTIRDQAAAKGIVY